MAAEGVKLSYNPSAKNASSAVLAEMSQMLNSIGCAICSGKVGVELTVDKDEAGNSKLVLTTKIPTKSAKAEAE